MTIWGYMGKLLFVDLSTRETRVEPLDERVARDFIGGYGMGARILYERMPAGVDPLGPDNLLGFVTGPFTGTPAICSGRFTVVGKSPLTGGWGDANCGGVWGPYLRFAGYDAVFFSGVAAAPTYVLIDDGEVTFHDASPLWGKDCLDTEDELWAVHGGDAAVACIGPAGEAVSLLSSIITDKGRAAARSGLGAVMGSKKLKAVVVRGSQEVPLPDPALAKQLRTKWARQLMGEGVEFKVHGTTSRTIPNTVIGDTPIKNWIGTYPDDYPDVSLDKIDENVFYAERDKPYGCWHCHIRCGGHLKARTGRARVSHVPEYETIAMCGTVRARTTTSSPSSASTTPATSTAWTRSPSGGRRGVRHGVLRARHPHASRTPAWTSGSGDGDAMVALTEQDRPARGHRRPARRRRDAGRREDRQRRRAGTPSTPAARSCRLTTRASIPAWPSSTGSTLRRGGTHAAAARGSWATASWRPQQTSTPSPASASRTSAPRRCATSCPPAATACSPTRRIRPATSPSS